MIKLKDLKTGDKFFLYEEVFMKTDMPNYLLESEIKSLNPWIHSEPHKDIVYIHHPKTVACVDIKSGNLCFFHEENEVNKKESFFQMLKNLFIE